MNFKTILFPTDYSPTSQRALSVATSMARDSDALLLIAHVSEREPYPVGEPAHSAPSPSDAELEQLHSVVPSDPDVRYRHHYLYGEPGSAEVTKPENVIVNFAEENDVDLIVLGTHGRTGFGRLLMGSVAEAVLRSATCPVLTIRQPTSE
jgi:nucleotide-binding universal stress UspA family protein